MYCLMVEHTKKGNLHALQLMLQLVVVVLVVESCDVSVDVMTVSLVYQQ